MVAVACLALGGDTAFAQARYQLPPKVVVDILDARPLPTVAVSPSRQVIALLERASMPSIADLSQPMLRLAGARINPRTNGPQRPPALTGISLVAIADGKTVKVAVPAGARIDWIGFSPNSRSVAFTETKAAGIALWIADAATGAARPVPGVALNATMGQACAWVNDASLLCRTVPAVARSGARRRPPRPKARTSRRTRARPRPSAPTRTSCETRTTRRCSSTTSPASWRW